MAERTTADETLTREEVVTYFDHLSNAFDETDDEVRVRVGNKTVELEPPETVELSVDVIERSAMFRGKRETIEIELSWKP
ncbi:amphi-Trp domain-containing protein [Natrarchaeobius chitinivorans]|uniref:Amphi-Trp domain-containing protein n=1 Tax=Natrarchaeobius chitinivorans TaxID=1679083 RepID=A0A3N6LXD0_NATCH|nr:amphi-Trp domain-containing protein [Natrarchaeobius chitinivorans]RQG92434.1 amphi-Trp domain-containing protein [Natrarchaeobius chitinivorans]